MKLDYRLLIYSISWDIPMSLLKLEKIVICMFIKFYTSVDRGLETTF